MFEQSTAIVIGESPLFINIVTSALRDDLKVNKVISVHKIQEAKKYLEKVSVDCIVCNSEIPDDGCYDFLKEIRTKEINIPFVMISPKTDKTSFEKAVDAGVTDFISQPFSPVDFVKRMRSNLRSQHKRGARRYNLDGKYACKIKTSNGILLSDVINISTSGCLLRTDAKKIGALIYDDLEITFEFGTQDIVSLCKVIRFQSESDEGLIKKNLIQMALTFKDWSTVETEKLEKCLNGLLI